MLYECREPLANSEILMNQKSISKVPEQKKTHFDNTTNIVVSVHVV